MANLAVFDASGLLAVLFNQPGAAKAIDCLHGALVSSVSLAEVHSLLLARGHTAAQSWNRVRSMGFEVVPFSEEQARLAGELRAEHLSLGDRAALALALDLDKGQSATLYTANGVLKSLPDVAAILEIVRIA